QLAFDLAPLAVIRRAHQPLAECRDREVIDIELLRQQRQEALAPRAVEREIRPSEIGSAGTARDGAAARLQAIAQLGAQPLGVVPRQLWSRRAAEHAARLLGDVAPGGAQRA